MKSYAIQIARRARTALGAIETLADDPRPHGVKPLVAVGSCRVRVDIDDAVRVVAVTRIGHRGSIYQEV